MDGLSGAASGIAVVSFTLQLAESATKLYNFWKSVDEAPEFVHEIVEDLKLLSTTLAEITLHEQKHGNNGSVTDILESCMSQSSVETHECSWRYVYKFLMGNGTQAPGRFKSC